MPEYRDAVKLHPLHTPDWVAAYVLNTGHYQGARRTGRSTAQALALVAAALQRPGTAIKIVDHPGSYAANVHLRRMAQSIVQTLELEHIVFTEDTIKFG